MPGGYCIDSPVPLLQPVVIPVCNRIAIDRNDVVHLQNLISRLYPRLPLRAWFGLSRGEVQFLRSKPVRRLIKTATCLVEKTPDTKVIRLFLTIPAERILPFHAKQRNPWRFPLPSLTSISRLQLQRQCNANYVIRLSRSCRVVTVLLERLSDVFFRSRGHR